jgi:hypothetical protein
MYDWEFDQPEKFWVQGYCTGHPFDAIVTAVRTGRVEKLRVGIETKMWTKEKRGVIPMPRTFHLAPPVDEESTSPAVEFGTMKSPPGFDIIYPETRHQKLLWNQRTFHRSGWATRPWQLIRFRYFKEFGDTRH